MMPKEKTAVESAVAVMVAQSTSDLDPDHMCDLDGARLEVHGRTTVAGAEYELRRCSANPAHLKQIPL